MHRTYNIKFQIHIKYNILTLTLFLFHSRVPSKGIFDLILCQVHQFHHQISECHDFTWLFAGFEKIEVPNTCEIAVLVPVQYCCRPPKIQVLEPKNQQKTKKTTSRLHFKSSTRGAARRYISMWMDYDVNS